MAKVAVIDDDDLIRLTVSRVLRAHGHQVIEARNGAEGFELIGSERPDLVISDVNMPVLDGFAMLERLRQLESTATMPVIMLTSLDDRLSFRKGMTLGADDYLPKPFSRDELLEAVNARLTKQHAIHQTIEQELARREQDLRDRFARQLAGAEVPADTLVPVGPAERTMQAIVLHADLRQFTGFAERLTGPEVAELLSDYAARASRAVLTHGGAHLRYQGEGLIALFPSSDPDSALRAARAALLLTQVAHTLRVILAARFPDRGLPEFSIGAALAQGEVQLTRFTPDDDLRPVGDAVRLAVLLQQQGEHLGYVVTATEPLRAALGIRAIAGERKSLRLPGRSLPVDVFELRAVTGLQALDEGEGSAPGAPLLDALRENARATARAVKQAYAENLERLRQASQTDVSGLLFRGYRLDRKIGSGGMSDVFLAHRESDQMQVVLKVLDMRAEKKRHLLSRFIQEYNLVSRIKHPNVVQIFDQGITDEHAFIAMEYLDGGDLRAIVKSRPDPREALQMTVQAARALQAIHAAGVVHRDLKPENLMLRVDGSLALADFGIAKGDDSASLTHHDHIVGTPYYISPEQASTGIVDARSDLYSLGVILFELLTGTKPYKGSSIAAIIGLHINGAIPKLPAELAYLQGLIDRLMAKNPNDRFASSEHLIKAIEAIQAA